MKLEWDPEKNSDNIEKHGIPFEEAQEIFSDPLHVSILDERFSYFEERWITIGRTEAGQTVVVAHLYYVEQQDEIIRIISARPATGREKKVYETVE